MEFGLLLLAVVHLGVIAMLGLLAWVLVASGAGRGNGYRVRRRAKLTAAEVEADGEGEVPAPTWQAMGYEFCDREGRSTPHVWRADGTKRCCSCKHTTVGGTGE
ncbi:hypothetical protein [Streptomyces sp. G1]|uniref:hypothetical protein n=1 Tax=Streptomyces sp. G1 TaxID=361572 RepID=UPI00202FCF58|nr:hypothetical protein [Streptomyces sp. G1]MCM1964908.1 hypothetical protein [Streptomyces sp. G1]